MCIRDRRERERECVPPRQRPGCAHWCARSSGGSQSSAARCPASARPAAARNTSQPLLREMISVRYVK
eukprot:2146087-Rhodomonas_salina.1